PRQNAAVRPCLGAIAYHQRSIADSRFPRRHFFGRAARKSRYFTGEEQSALSCCARLNERRFSSSHQPVFQLLSLPHCAWAAERDIRFRWLWHGLTQDEWRRESRG